MHTGSIHSAVVTGSTYTAVYFVAEPVVRTHRCWYCFDAEGIPLQHSLLLHYGVLVRTASMRSDDPVWQAFAPTASASCAVPTFLAPLRAPGDRCSSNRFTSSLCLHATIEGRPEIHIQTGPSAKKRIRDTNQEAMADRPRHGWTFVRAHKGRDTWRLAYIYAVDLVARDVLDHCAARFALLHLLH